MARLQRESDQRGTLFLSQSDLDSLEDGIPISAWNGSMVQRIDVRREDPVDVPDWWGDD